MALSTLKGHLVAPKDIDVAEYVFKCKINYHISPKKDQQFVILKKLATTLANSYGGRILTENYQGIVKPGILDTWKTQLKDAFNFVPGHVYLQCFQYHEDGLNLQIHVNKSPVPITLETYANIRLTAQNTTVYDPETIHHILTQTTTATEHIFGQLNGLKSGDIFPHTENKNVEFKDWRINTLSDLISKLSLSGTSGCIFSFPNITGGGHIFFGIKEGKDNNKVVGINLSLAEERQFRSEFQNFLERDPHTQAPRIWGEEGNKPVEGTDWSVSFHEVQHPSPDRKVLVHLYVAQYAGGVFTQKPEAYTMGEDNNPLELTFQEWRCMILSGRYEAAHDISPTKVLPIFSSHIGKPAKKDKRTKHVYEPAEYVHPLSTSVENTSVRAKVGAKLTSTLSNMFTKSPKPSNVQMRTKVSSRAINRGVSGLESLSWTSHNVDWEKNLAAGTVDMSENICELAHRSNLLQPQYPINVTPTKKTIAASIVDAAKVKALFKSIKKHTGRQPAFAIASESWLSNFNNTLVFPTPKGHCFDIFVVDHKGNTHLWSFMEEKGSTSDQADQWEYLMSIGRWTKMKFLRCSAAGQRLRSLVVKCHLFTMCGYERHDNSQIPEKTHYDMLPVIQTILATLLIQKETYIKTIFGSEHLVNLTCKQVECILDSGFASFNLIEGAQGSGKSYIAFYLCTKYSKEKTVYICGTEAYNNMLVFYDNCCPVLAKHDNTIIKLINSRGLDDKTCIIIDDGHHLSCKAATWNKLFHYIRQIRGLHLFVLLDSAVQCYTMRISTLKKCLSSFCKNNRIMLNYKLLRTIHRNSRKISSFLMANAPVSNAYGNEMSCSHCMAGDDVELKKVVGLGEEGPNNALVGLLRDLTDSKMVLSGKERLYQCHEVSVIIDTANTERDITLYTNIIKEYYPESNVQSASQFPVVGVRVDRLDNYMGMDSSVCICIPSMSGKEKKVTEGASFGNPRYRCFVVSRAVYRAIFLTESTLDANMVQHLKLDRVPYVERRSSLMNPMAPGVRKLHHIDREAWVSSVIFLSRPHYLECVYVDYEANQLKAVNSAGRPIPEHPLLRAALDISGRICLISCSGDREQVVLAHQDEEGRKWSVLKWMEGAWKLIVTHSLAAGGVWGITHTTNGDIVMLVDQAGRYTLCRFEVDGRVLWQRTVGMSTTCWNTPICAAPSGQIYLADPDSDDIRVYSDSGHHIQDLLDPTTIQTPRVVCLTSSGSHLCVAHDDNSVSLVSSDGSQIRFMLQTSGVIHSLCLYQDQYLSVGTYQGLLLFDVSIILPVQQ